MLNQGGSLAQQGAQSGRPSTSNQPHKHLILGNSNPRQFGPSAILRTQANTWDRGKQIVNTHAQPPTDDSARDYQSTASPDGASSSTGKPSTRLAPKSKLRLRSKDKSTQSGKHKECCTTHSLTATKQEYSGATADQAPSPSQHSANDASAVTEQKASAKMNISYSNNSQPFEVPREPPQLAINSAYLAGLFDFAGSLSIVKPPWSPTSRRQQARFVISLSLRYCPDAPLLKSFIRWKGPSTQSGCYNSFSLKVVGEHVLPILAGNLYGMPQKAVQIMAACVAARLLMEGVQGSDELIAWLQQMCAANAFASDAASTEQCRELEFYFSCYYQDNILTSEQLLHAFTRRRKGGTIPEMQRVPGSFQTRLAGYWRKLGPRQVVSYFCAGLVCRAQYMLQASSQQGLTDSLRLYIPVHSTWLMAAWTRAMAFGSFTDLDKRSVLAFEQEELGRVADMCCRIGIDTLPWHKVHMKRAAALRKFRSMVKSMDRSSFKQVYAEGRRLIRDHCRACTEVGVVLFHNRSLAISEAKCGEVVHSLQQCLEQCVRLKEEFGVQPIARAGQGPSARDVYFCTGLDRLSDFSLTQSSSGKFEAGLSLRVGEGVPTAEFAVALRKYLRLPVHAQVAASGTEVGGCTTPAMKSRTQGVNERVSSGAPAKHKRSAHDAQPNNSSQEFSSDKLGKDGHAAEAAHSTSDDANTHFSSVEVGQTLLPWMFRLVDWAPLSAHKVAAMVVATRADPALLAEDPRLLQQLPAAVVADHLPLPLTKVLCKCAQLAATKSRTPGQEWSAYATRFVELHAQHQHDDQAGQQCRGEDVEVATQRAAGGRLWEGLSRQASAMLGNALLSRACCLALVDLFGRVNFDFREARLQYNFEVATGLRVPCARFLQVKLAEGGVDTELGDGSCLRVVAPTAQSAFVSFCRDSRPVPMLRREQVAGWESLLTAAGSLGGLQQLDLQQAVLQLTSPTGQERSPRFQSVLDKVRRQLCSVAVCIEGKEDLLAKVKAVDVTPEEAYVLACIDACAVFSFSQAPLASGALKMRTYFQLTQRTSSPLLDALTAQFPAGKVSTGARSSHSRFSMSDFGALADQLGQWLLPRLAYLPRQGPAACALVLAALLQRGGNAAPGGLPLLVEQVRRGDQGSYKVVGQAVLLALQRGVDAAVQVVQQHYLQHSLQASECGGRGEKLMPGGGLGTDPGVGAEHSNSDYLPCNGLGDSTHEEGHDKSQIQVEAKHSSGGAASVGSVPFYHHVLFAATPDSALMSASEQIQQAFLCGYQHRRFIPRLQINPKADGRVSISISYAFNIGKSEELRHLAQRLMSPIGGMMVVPIKQRQKQQKKFSGSTPSYDFSSERDSSILVDSELGDQQKSIKKEGKDAESLLKKTMPAASQEGALMGYNVSVQGGWKLLRFIESMGSFTSLLHESEEYLERVAALARRVVEYDAGACMLRDVLDAYEVAGGGAARLRKWRALSVAQQEEKMAGLELQLSGHAVPSKESQYFVYLADLLATFTLHTPEASPPFLTFSMASNTCPSSLLQLACHLRCGFATMGVLDNTPAAFRVTSMREMSTVLLPWFYRNRDGLAAAGEHVLLARLLAALIAFPPSVPVPQNIFEQLGAALKASRRQRCSLPPQLEALIMGLPFQAQGELTKPEAEQILNEVQVILSQHQEQLLGVRACEADVAPQFRAADVSEDIEARGKALLDAHLRFEVEGLVDEAGDLRAFASALSVAVPAGYVALAGWLVHMFEGEIFYESEDLPLGSHEQRQNQLKGAVSEQGQASGLSKYEQQGGDSSELSSDFEAHSEGTNSVQERLVVRIMSLKRMQYVFDWLEHRKLASAGIGTGAQDAFKPAEERPECALLRALVLQHQPGGLGNVLRMYSMLPGCAAHARSLAALAPSAAATRSLEQQVQWLESKRKVAEQQLAERFEDGEVSVVGSLPDGPQQVDAEISVAGDRARQGQIQGGNCSNYAGVALFSRQDIAQSSIIDADFDVQGALKELGDKYGPSLARDAKGLTIPRREAQEDLQRWAHRLGVLLMHGHFKVDFSQRVLELRVHVEASWQTEQAPGLEALAQAFGGGEVVRFSNERTTKWCLRISDARQVVDLLWPYANCLALFGKRGPGLASVLLVALCQTHDVKLPPRIQAGLAWLKDWLSRRTLTSAVLCAMHALASECSFENIVNAVSALLPSKKSCKADLLKANLSRSNTEVLVPPSSSLAEVGGCLLPDCISHETEGGQGVDAKSAESADDAPLAEDSLSSGALLPNMLTSLLESLHTQPKRALLQALLDCGRFTVFLRRAFTNQDPAMLDVHFKVTFRVEQGDALARALVQLCGFGKVLTSKTQFVFHVEGAADFAALRRFVLWRGPYEFVGEEAFTFGWEAKGRADAVGVGNLVGIQEFLEQWGVVYGRSSVAPELEAVERLLEIAGDRVAPSDKQLPLASSVLLPFERAKGVGFAAHFMQMPVQAQHAALEWYDFGVFDNATSAVIESQERVGFAVKLHASVPAPLVPSLERMRQRVGCGRITRLKSKLEHPPDTASGSSTNVEEGGGQERWRLAFKFVDVWRQVLPFLAARTEQLPSSCMLLKCLALASVYSKSLGSSRSRFKHGSKKMTYLGRALQGASLTPNARVKIDQWYQRARPHLGGPIPQEITDSARHLLHQLTKVKGVKSAKRTHPEYKLRQVAPALRGGLAPNIWGGLADFKRTAYIQGALEVAGEKVPTDHAAGVFSATFGRDGAFVAQEAIKAVGAGATFVDEGWGVHQFRVQGSWALQKLLHFVTARVVQEWASRAGFERLARAVAADAQEAQWRSRLERDKGMLRWGGVLSTLAAVCLQDVEVWLGHQDGLQAYYLAVGAGRRQDCCKCLRLRAVL